MMKKNTAMVLILAILTALFSFVYISCGDEAASTSASAFIYGDVNGDGEVGPFDAMLILRYDAMLIADLDNAEVAELSGDGAIDSYDASLILRYDAMLIEFFPNERYTVSFDLNYSGNSGSIAEQILKYGEMAVKPSDPERAGYLFDGWYTEPACDNEYAFTSPVKSSFILYAGWTEEPVSEATSSEEESKDIYPEGAYIVKRFSTSDIAWEQVPKADIDIYKWVDSVEYEAYAQLVYIEGWGFICKMTCEESDPPAQYTQYGDPVYLDSCMEFFAAWDNKSYINIESNSKGTLCVQFGETKKNRKDATEYLSLNEMFKVTPAVEDESWTLTMEIPIEKLQSFYPQISDATFESGYTFKGNFYKIGSDPVDGTRHYGMWNEVKTPTADFHQPSYFGTLVIE